MPLALRSAPTPTTRLRIKPLKTSAPCGPWSSYTPPNCTKNADEPASAPLHSLPFFPLRSSPQRRLQSLHGCLRRERHGAKLRILEEPRFR